MLKKATLFLLSLLLIACPALLSAQDADSGESQTEDSADTETAGEQTKLWNISGYVESENFIMYGRGLKQADYLNLSGQVAKVARNQYLFNKVEAHGYLDLRVGTDTIHARGILHGYLYPTGNENDYLPNRLMVNELYLKWLTRYTNLEIGKQVIKWGTADVINPTSYFTPLDLQEIFFKDEDEMFLGVHALSLTFLFGDFSLQLVISPIASASLLPSTNSPWYVKLPRQYDVIPLYYHHQSPDIPKNGANICYGGRFAGTVSVVDFSFSAYRGIDRDILFYPYMEMSGAIPTVYVVPKYRNITCFGFDMAASIRDVTIQVEAAYSFNKNGVTDPDILKLSYAGIKTTHYINFAAGFNWLIDGEDFNITVEFNKSMYLENPDRFIDPFISDILIARIEKKFIDSTLYFKLQGILSLDLDFLLMPVVGYDFQNGLTIEAEGGIFEGKPDTLFGSYDSRDIIRLRARYQF